METLIVCIIFGAALLSMVAYIKKSFVKGGACHCGNESQCHGKSKQGNCC
ncbi:MAG: hypothetical protein HQL15_07045 [Candidatus Omnitrophica bacterium]|nr:hypothetical protein [Candidatus Omnitrophota bacterium]